jgi:hypothetical protein
VHTDIFRTRYLPLNIVVSLSQDFLTDCPEGRPEQRTASALMVGQRSVYEIIALEDLVDLAGVLFMPGVVPAFVADRADLISNRNLPLDQVWPGYTDHLRSRMFEGSSPEARLHILDDCLTSLLTRRTPRAWVPHPAVKFRDHSTLIREFDESGSGPRAYKIRVLSKAMNWQTS